MVERGIDQLEAMFARVRDRGRAAFLPYMTAGLPDLSSSADLFVAMADAGADGFEVGIPYADPLMDGPVVQAAGARALASGVDVDRALAVVEQVASRTGKPTIVMTYVNPVLRHGIDAFVTRLADVGASGLIVADLPADEAEPFLHAAASVGIGMVLFAAPTTTDARLARIAAARPAFVYGIAELGVTGERQAVSSRAAGLARRVRETIDVPLVLGVGITTPADVAAAARVADGVIVGSALVRRVLDAPDPVAAVRTVREAVAELAAATEVPDRPEH